MLGAFLRGQLSLMVVLGIIYGAGLLIAGISIGPLVGMIAAEFFLSATGVGKLIMEASQEFDTAGVFASIFVIGVLGVGLTRVGLMIEQHFARWRQ